MVFEDEILQIIGQLDSTTPQDGYISMPTKVFLHFNQLPFNVYILVDAKYVKLIKADEVFERRRVEMFYEKGVESLYFEREHRTTFSALLISQLKKRLGMETKSFIEKTQSSSEVYNTVNDIILKLGVKPKVLEVCELGLKTLEKEVASAGKNEISKYFRLLKTVDRFDYKYKLIQLTSLCCQNILDQLDWPGKADIAKKLFYAAYFCDFSITNQGHIEVRSQAELENLLEHDKKIVEEHAQKSAEILKSIDIVPSDVIRVVLQHHGSSNGIGIKDAKSSTISPMSMIFIIAQEFSAKILKDPTASYENVIQELKSSFEDSKLHEYVLKLESSFL